MLRKATRSLGFCKGAKGAERVPSQTDPVPAAASTSAQVLRMLADIRPAPDHTDELCAAFVTHACEARLNARPHGGEVVTDVGRLL